MKMPNPEDFAIVNQPGAPQMLSAFLSKIPSPDLLLNGALHEVKSFTLTTNSPVLPKPSIKLSGDLEAKGEFTATFVSKTIYANYIEKSGLTADELFGCEDSAAAQFKALYEGKPWIGVDHAEGTDKSGYFTRRTSFKPCPAPNRTDIMVPAFDDHELKDAKSVRKAVFMRLLTIMRQQGAPGYEIDTDAEGNLTAYPKYRTQQGGRCPFGYLIPDERYHVGLERMCSNNPYVMAAMDLGAYQHDEEICIFLGRAQNELHDRLVSLPRYAFMEEFEQGARRLANYYDLYYYAPGEGRGIPEWARA